MPLGKLLARHYSVCCIDLPGFGSSPPPAKVWGTKDYATAILDYLKSERIERAHLLGHSFGGKVAAAAALLDNERVMTLTLLAAAGVPLPWLWRQRRRLLRWLYRGCHLCDYCLPEKVALTARFRKKFASADYRRACGIMREIFIKVLHEELTDELNAVAAPALILWGEEDRDTPISMAYRWKELLPCAEVKVFPHKDHHLHTGVGAHLMAYHILPFIERHRL